MLVIDDREPTDEERAQMEELYALHRLFHSSECLRLAATIESSLKDRHYSWMETQVRLEEFSCLDSQATRSGLGAQPFAPMSAPRRPIQAHDARYLSNPSVEVHVALYFSLSVQLLNEKTLYICI